MGGCAFSPSTTNQHETAWLIDSSIYVFKAWYTKPSDLVDVDGNPISAVIGFMEFVYKLLSIEQPKLIAFAFDESLQSSHRRDIYPDYKANRSPAPESLKRQFQYCREFIKTIGIHQAASSLYEADDLIGTWAKSLRQINIPINIISADKDLAQLVYENDHWWEYLRGDKLNNKAIHKRFRAKPRQIADQLALAGDKSDNIPGVPGIGMSTAGKLLRRFDNLENLYASMNEISTMQIRGAAQIQQLIKEHQEVIKLSRKLTGIVCDIEEVDNSIFERLSTDEESFDLFCDKLYVSTEQRQMWHKLLV